MGWLHANVDFFMATGMSHAGSRRGTPVPVALFPLLVHCSCLHGGVGTAFLQPLLELHLCSLGCAHCFPCERFPVLCALVGFSSRSMACMRAVALSLVTQQGKFILWICPKERPSELTFPSAWRGTNPRTRHPRTDRFSIDSLH